MASSSRNNATGTSSPSKRHSRVADAIQVSPYLTHVVRHHGQVTLIPPENSGRIRKEKKRRPGIRGVNSSSSPDLPRLLATRSRPNTPRPTSSSSILGSQHDLNNTPRTTHTRSRSYQNRSQEEDLRIPDFPPPSFEEAMLERPSPSGSTPGSVVVGTQPVVDSTPLDQDALDLTSSSDIGSPRSASSHSSVEDVSDTGHRPLWEEDREAGFSLEERVRRELERRQLSDSLPRAPLMRYIKESDRCEANTGASEADDDASRTQQRSQPAPTREESPGDGPLTVDSQVFDSPHQASDPIPSASRGDTEEMDMDTEGACMVAKCPISAKGKKKERTPTEESTSDESLRRDTHRQHCEGTFSMIRQALNAPLHLQIERPDSGTITSDALSSSPLNTSGQPASVEQSFGPSYSPREPSTPLLVSNSNSTLISAHNPLLIASHSDISINIPPVTSPSSSAASHSASVASTAQPNLPLSTPQVPLPDTKAIVPPLPPRPPLASASVSVRDRISRFESMRNRPVPPPPPVRPVIRRPPPPVPSSSSSRDSFAARARGESSSDQSRNDNTPSLHIRRRIPPPVPPRRSRKSDEVIPSEPIQSLAPSTVSSASTAPSSSSPIHSTNGNVMVSSTIRDASGAPVAHALSERVASHEGHQEWSNSVGQTQIDVVEDEAALPLSVPATPVSAPIETRDNSVSVAPSNGGTEEATSRVVEIGNSQISPSPALAETYLTDTSETTTPENINVVNQGSDVAPENASYGRSGDHDDTGSEIVPRQESTSDDIPSSSGASQPLQTLQPMFTGLTDLDLLLARLDDPDFTFSGRSYDDLLLLEEIMGSATGPSDHLRAKFEDIPLGKVEVLRRRVTKDGRTKLKIALFGVIVDKCGICLVQFKEGVFACLLPCQHAFHDGCLRLWMRRGQTCPLCRGALCEY